MSVYSTRFIAGLQTTGNLSYTVPVGSVAVLRDIEVWNNGTASTFSFLGVYVSGSLAGVIGLESDMALNHGYQWQGRVVLHQGDEIIANQSSSSALWLVSGYLFAA